jgi:hypothetical protein
MITARLFHCYIAVSALLIVSCHKASHDFAADVEAVCSCAGVKRNGPVTVATDPHDGYTVATFEIVADGTAKRYQAHFNQKHFLYNFLPEDYMPYMTSNYVDTLPDQTTRTSLVDRIIGFNACLKWKLYGKPIMQTVGSAFLVTYLSVPEAELKKHVYLDPYVTFIISPAGTVLGAYYMAGA